MMDLLEDRYIHTSPSTAFCFFYHISRTNRFHVAVGLSSKRSQTTLKFGKNNKEVYKV